MVKRCCGGVRRVPCLNEIEMSALGGVRLVAYLIPTDKKAYNYLKRFFAGYSGFSLLLYREAVQ